MLRFVLRSWGSDATIHNIAPHDPPDPLARHPTSCAECERRSENAAHARGADQREHGCYTTKSEFMFKLLSPNGFPCIGTVAAPLSCQEASSALPLRDDTCQQRYLIRADATTTAELQNYGRLARSECIGDST